MADDMYCEHNRTADACEECAYAAAKAAGHPVPARLYSEVTPADEADVAPARSAPRKRK